MNDKDTYQLNLDSAKFYEKNFVPTLFKKWVNVTLDNLDLNDSDKLLDVACGTGIVARTARNHEDFNIDITGCDINPGMLEVAKEIDPNINWIRGRAENLPFEDNSFDKISCQFGFMFFEDKLKSLLEMERVRRKNGRTVILIWDNIENNVGYFDLLKIIEKIGGTDIGDILRSPFNLGNKKDIDNIFEESNIKNFKIESIKKHVEFPSIEHWIECDIKASPISEIISKDQYSNILKMAKIELAKYSDKEGKVKFNMSAHAAIIE